MSNNNFLANKKMSGSTRYGVTFRQVVPQYRYNALVSRSILIAVHEAR